MREIFIIFIIEIALSFLVAGASYVIPGGEEGRAASSVSLALFASFNIVFVFLAYRKYRALMGIVEFALKPDWINKMKAILFWQRGIIVCLATTAVVDVMSLIIITFFPGEQNAGMYTSGITVFAALFADVGEIILYLFFTELCELFGVYAGSFWIMGRARATRSLFKVYIVALVGISSGIGYLYALTMGLFEKVAKGELPGDMPGASDTSVITSFITYFTEHPPTVTQIGIMALVAIFAGFTLYYAFRFLRLLYRTSTMLDKR